MRIGILQTGESPAQLADVAGDYPDMFERLLAGHGFEFQTWRVLDNVLPPDVHAADGWLITGSRFGAYEPHPWIPPLEDFIRASFAAHVPMVGVCFGHQIIAQAMGGKVEKFAGGWSVGPTEYDFDGKKMVLNAWHQDQVTKVPEGAKVVGSTDFCANAALLYDDVAFTVQPHPEFQSEFVDGLLKVRAPGIVPEPLIKDGTARLERPLDDRTMAGQIAAFFKRTGKGHAA
jgi:GMP synthase (glutamine-hydrolysing)